MDLLLMTTNAEECIINTLESWIDSVNNIYILLNNITDKTESILKEYKQKHKNITIFKKRFNGFSNTRNELIKLSKSKKFIFIDDSYELIDKELFKKESKLFNYGVGAIEVYTNGICQIRHLINTKYMYKGHIHETIDFQGTVQKFKSRIYDRQYESHIKRTFDRIDYDMEQLKKENQNDDKIKYYICNYLVKKYHMNLITLEELNENINKKLLEIKDEYYKKPIITILKLVNK